MNLFNNFKTAMLMAILFVLVAFVGKLVGGNTGLIVASIIAFFLNFFAFYFSDKIALAAMGGQEVDEQSAPDLVPMVRRLAKNAGIPMPKVYICPQDAPNAFATGRSPSNAAVAVTHGAIELLSYEELEGVMAHELAHIKNRDTLISTIAGTMAGALSVLANFAFIFMHMRDEDERDSPLALVGLLLALIFAPIAAALIQMAISRSREYVADADAARIAGTPDGLINALSKLDSWAKQIPLQGAHESSAHQFIVKPLTGESFASLFSTHPATSARIDALTKLRGQI